jgi:RNA polymerase sigma factor (sigma-70 family)
MSATARNDAELVGKSLAGSRDAFGQIVGRYQSLVCSLAYSATGSLSQSEDLAQDTFVTAWKQLAGLREPEKLRAWLCGIARNLINNSLRRQGREPSHQAESLEEISESHSPEPQPVEQTISNEEAAILWRSLEKIPEIYREPLVLFYREHQSIEAVAQNLELTEDAVKQRLSRGRKLLHEEVLAFVEGALARTNPGQAFTLGVLAALPALTISAKAATMGAAAAKGSATAAGAGLVGLLGAILCPLLAFLNLFRVWRLSHKAARLDRERKVYKIFYPVLAGSIVVFILLTSLLMSHGDSLIKTNPSLLHLVLSGGKKFGLGTAAGGSRDQTAESRLGISQPLSTARLAVHSPPHRRLAERPAGEGIETGESVDCRR